VHLREPDPIVVSIQTALEGLARSNEEAARRELLRMDVGYARELRRAKLAQVAKVKRAEATTPDLRSKRGTLSSSTKRAIFERDGYTCRLCGLKTIDLDVLRMLSRRFPVELPFHSAWKQDVTSLVYWTHSTSLEHVIPIARGGVDDPSNFATSCYGCNDARSDLLLEEGPWLRLRPITDVQWNGLREYLPRLQPGRAITAPELVPASLELRPGMLVRTTRPGSQSLSTYRIETIDSTRHALLREMWKSRGRWVASKHAASAELNASVEILAAAAPQDGIRRDSEIQVSPEKSCAYLPVMSDDRGPRSKPCPVRSGGEDRRGQCRCSTQAFRK
jgi:5-methylcytosine-specific restriction endonuclease McrA